GAITGGVFAREIADEGAIDLNAHGVGIVRILRLKNEQRVGRHGAAAAAMRFNDRGDHLLAPRDADDFDGKRPGAIDLDKHHPTSASRVGWCPEEDSNLHALASA